MGMRCLIVLLHMTFTQGTCLLLRVTCGTTSAGNGRGGTLISSSVSSLLPAGTASEAEDAVQSAMAAVFYSVSSTQEGLTGVDLGHSLIDQVRMQPLKYARAQRCIYLVGFI